MEGNIIVGEAFCFPYLKQWIGVKEITVYGKGNVGFVGYIIFPDVRGKPTFQPPSLIVVSTGAFVLKFVSCFETIYKKIPDIFSRFREAFYQFLEI